MRTQQKHLHLSLVNEGASAFRWLLFVSVLPVHILSSVWNIKLIPLVLLFSSFSHCWLVSLLVFCTSCFRTQIVNSEGKEQSSLPFSVYQGGLTCLGTNLRARLAWRSHSSFFFANFTVPSRSYPARLFTQASLSLPFLSCERMRRDILCRYPDQMCPTSL